jgi:hypothetical protein
VNEKWCFFEGTIGESYLLTGTGSERDEDGIIYSGEWKQGKKHGSGKETASQSGEYSTGKWKEGVKIG